MAPLHGNICSHIFFYGQILYMHIGLVVTDGIHAHQILALIHAEMLVILANILHILQAVEWYTPVVVIIKIVIIAN